MLTAQISADRGGVLAFGRNRTLGARLHARASA
jgi:hypothetical protein